MILLDKTHHQVMEGKSRDKAVMTELNKPVKINVIFLYEGLTQINVCVFEPFLLDMTQPLKIHRQVMEGRFLSIIVRTELGRPGKRYRIIQGHSKVQHYSPDI